jgi:hypothetical protein
LVGAQFPFFGLLISGGNVLSVGRREETQNFADCFVSFFAVAGISLVFVVVTGSTGVGTVLGGVRSKKVILSAKTLGLNVLTRKNYGRVLHNDFGLRICLLLDDRGKIVPVDRQLGILQWSRIKLVSIFA